jgi:serine/threonine protein kinase/formylglycine-generating enzyme required for sulfatase activity
MPFCGKCGTKFPDDFQFCPKCGTPKDTAKASKDASEKASEIGQTIQRNGQVYGIINLENLPVGHIIDERYEIKEKLGQGGFGAVYRAFDKKMNVDKALKVIPEAVTHDRRAMQNLRQEAQTMIRLNHPNIVRVYDFQEQGAVKYIDMEFIDGKSLNERLLDYPHQRMPEEEVKKLALQICEGLDYAHNQNIIHRDIKPQNIMLTKDEQIKITDFGIAETLRTSMSMIQNTSTTGTIMYMSPEQLRGRGITKQSDIYSLGATLYELLNGKAPFYMGDLTYQILNEVPQKLSHISGEMNAILQICLAKEAADRFKNCDELKRAIKEGLSAPAVKPPIKAHAPTVSRQQTAQPRPKSAFPLKTVLLSAALVTVILLVLLAVSSGWFGKTGQESNIITMEDMKDDNWENLSTIDKRRVEALLLQADDHYVKNKLVSPPQENAYSVYKEVLKIHSGNKYALAQLNLIRDDFIKRARPHIDREHYDQADQILNSGFTYFPDDDGLTALRNVNKINRLFAQANDQFKQKQPERSIGTLNEIMQINPKHQPSQQLKKDIGGYYLDNAERLFARKNYSQSITQYEKAAALLPENTEIKDKLEQARKEINALEKARQEKLAAEEREREAAARKELMDRFDMVFVKSGTFQMGSNDGGSDEKPVHTVTVDDFYIGRYEVTQKQWVSIMGSNFSCFKGDNLPVEQVGWNDVQAFIRKLNGGTDGKFRLPTEAEWEYAARGGNQSRDYTYAGSNNVEEVAWYNSNSGSKTHSVGQKKPNELGLYDMSGNVYEWCQDWYGAYASHAQTNPTGTDSGTFRVFRGGSWNGDARRVRVAYRYFYYPSYRSYPLGFRLARKR